MRWASEADAGANDTGNEVVATMRARLVGRRTQDVEDREQPGFYGGAYRARSSCCGKTRPPSRPW